MRILMMFFGILMLLVSGIYLACEKPTSPETPNTPPNTTVANVPVDSSIIFALVTLNWDGEDYDGFISGYKYRYITRHLTSDSVLIDTVVTPWKFTPETHITLPFESSAILNFQRFQVKAIDNNGDADPTPAEKRFYTYQTVRPTTNIISPDNNKIFFATDAVTDWWRGIPLVFTASDEDGELVEFGWAVDAGEWNWAPDTNLFIPPEYFTPLEGEHTIRVTSRDNTNLIDLVGDSVKIQLIRPTFDKQILIVDETNETLNIWINKFGAYIDADVDSFYAQIFGTSESWDFKNSGMPPKSKLGQYKLVIWHADNPYSNDVNHHKLPEHIDDIIDYLNVGGDFIMSGWRILKSFAPEEDFPKTFEDGSFIHDYLHIVEADETNQADFTHGIGWHGFSNVRVDSIKLQEFPYVGKLEEVNLIPRRAGFTDLIYTYGNAPNSPNTQWRGSPVGIRYYGTSFDTIVLGFPMFFLVKQDAEIMAAQMLQSLGY